MNDAIHLCLVGNDAICNLTPTIDPKMKPKEVVLAYGSEHSAYQSDIKNILNRRGIKTTALPIDNIWDIEHIRDSILQFVESNQTQALVLNASGGTKPMSLAAFEVFQAYDLPAFFVHHQTDRVVWLHPSDRPAQDIPDRIRLNEFLNAYGTEVESVQKNNASRREHHSLTKQLINQVEIYGKPLGILNRLAYNAMGNHQSPRLLDKHLRNEHLGSLVALFKTHGLCSLDQDRLTFPSEEARFYVNGGWLEDHVFSTLIELRNELHLQDSAQGMTVTRTSPQNLQIRNELDVVFLSDNRFHVIECKAKKFEKREDPDGPGAETLYKLDSLADLLGGTHGKGMLVSFQSLSKWDQQRAMDLNIETCVGAEIKRLKEYLFRWIVYSRKKDSTQ